MEEPTSGTMNFHIELLEITLNDFNISTSDYDPEMDNVVSSSIVPIFEQGESSREEIVEIRLSYVTYSNTQICSIKTTSRFKVTCDQEFNLRQDFKNPDIVEVFSQVLLLSNEHLQGMLKEKAIGNADFANLNFSTHFLDDLKIQVYSLLTAQTKN